MRCIRCGSINRYFRSRVIVGHKCIVCGEPYAFEVETDPFKLTDIVFEGVIEDVSGEDHSLFFTERQLWNAFNYRVWRRKKGKRGIGFAIASGIGGTVLTAATLNPIPFVFGVIGVVTGIRMQRHLRTNPRKITVPFEDFKKQYLEKWVKAHGPIERLLPPSPVLSPPKDGVPPDLTAYSFDRALITQTRDVAAMLVANRFHFENNCAILSMDGYPDHIRDMVMEMLRRNPNLTVYAVHDVSPTGCRMARELRGESWFPDSSIKIVDLGLRPDDAERLSLWVHQGPAAEIDAELMSNLTPDEITWLREGKSSEIEDLQPARLMQGIYQGFARAASAMPDETDAGFASALLPAIPIATPWVYDAGADIAAADSFG